jgi:hypothetical protein
VQPIAFNLIFFTLTTSYSRAVSVVTDVVHSFAFPTFLQPIREPLAH